MLNLIVQIYAPYKNSYKNYTSLVLNYLKYEFETNINMRNSDIFECVQLLSNSVNKVFNLIDKEIKRCNYLTNGCAIILLIEAVKVI